MKIKIISPAGNIAPDIVHEAVRTLGTWGHEAEIAPHALGSYGRYAAPPARRAADLVAALEDPETKAIWCSRGGYGCMQILEEIPADKIRANRKWLIGYSDVTALHALWQKAGVPSLHAPMMKQLAEKPEHPATRALQCFLRENPAPTRKLSTAPVTAAPHPHNLCGTATGKMVGGNLAVISGLHGTPFDFDYRGAILFVEDIGESPYKIDRMMQTLRLSGIFARISGMVIGQFTGCAPDPELPRSLSESIRDYLRPYRIPVAFNAPIGHVDANYPIAEGGMYKIEVSEEGVKISADTI